METCNNTCKQTQIFERTLDSGVTKTQTRKLRPQTSDPENSDLENSDPENSDLENSDPENSDPSKFIIRNKWRVLSMATQ